MSKVELLSHARRRKHSQSVVRFSTRGQQTPRYYIHKPVKRKSAKKGPLWNKLCESLANNMGHLASITYQLPVPNDLASLYEDLVNGTGQSIVSLFSDVQRHLNEKYDKSKVTRKIDDIKLLFELLKHSYDEKTINYEIYFEIESQLNNLINKIKESNFEDANNISNELMMVFKTLVDTNTMIHANSAKVLIVEDTGQKFGDMRIFKTKNE